MTSGEKGGNAMAVWVRRFWASVVLLFGVGLVFSSQGTGLRIADIKLIRKGTPHSFSLMPDGTFNLRISCTEDTGAVDIVFVLDTTGSMSSRIDAARAHIIEFAETMAATGYDCSFGIVTFGDGFNLPHGSTLTTDIDTFVSWMTMGSSGGGDLPETALDAIMAAVDSMDWRLGALRVIILLTDACFCQVGDPCFDCHSAWTADEVAATLLDRGIMFFPVTVDPPYCFDDCVDEDVSLWFYYDFSESTGGRWFDFEYGFVAIYSDIIPLLGTFQVIQVDVWNDTGFDLDSVWAGFAYRGSCIELLYGDDPALKTDVPAGDTVSFFWRVNYTSGCLGPDGCFTIYVTSDTFSATASGCMYIPNCWCTPTVAENIHPAPGVWTACDPQEVIIGIYDDDVGVDENTIVLRVNGEDHEYPEPGMVFANDTLHFLPDTGEFESGDSVFYELVAANDMGGCTLSTPVSGWFVVDLDPPAFSDEFPPDGEIVGGIPEQICIRVWDELSGLDTSTLALLVDGDTFTVDSAVVSFTDSLLCIDPVGLFSWGVGDTINVCAQAADLVQSEYCGPNADEYCWSFTIDFLHLWFPKDTLHPGDDVLFPLLAENPGRFTIRSYELWVEFNPSVVSVNDVVVTGSASSGFSVTWDTSGTVLHITAASTSPAADVDTFLFVDFHINDDALGASYTPVMLSSAILDSGRVGYYSEDGMILVLWRQTQWLHDLIFYGYAEGGGYLQPEVLTIGCADAATDGFDPTLDLLILPPPPSKTEVYLPMDDPDFPSITRVKRDIRNTYELPITWYVVTVEEPGSLYWSPHGFPDGVITLNGYIDMKRDSIYHYASNETLVITLSQPLPAEDTLSLCAGWSLASLPTAITVPGWAHFLEGVYAGPFEYDASTGTYFASDIPRTGFGFWILSVEEHTYNIGGIPLDEVTIPIYPGWNLIGSVNHSAWFETDPPDLILPGHVFGWDCESESFYPATSIEPGRGYWVYSLGTGTLTIH